MYQIKNGSIIVKKKFATREEAQAWAEENYRGHENYTILEKRKKRNCVCAREEKLPADSTTGGRPTRLYTCPEHGNLVIFKDQLSLLNSTELKK